MLHGGVADKIVAAARNAVGHIRGGGFVTPDLTRADQHPRASGGGR
jgi:hypothetical protein